MAPSRYSSVFDRMAAAGLPSSGRSEPTTLGGLRLTGVPGTSCANAVPEATAKAVSRARRTRRVMQFRPPCGWQVSLRLQMLTNARATVWRGDPPRSCTGGASLQGVGRVVRKARAFAAHQRDMPGMRPAPEAIDRVCEAGGHFRQVGRVDLGDVPEAGELGAGAGTRNQRLHLFRRQVLRLVEN